MSVTDVNAILGTGSMWVGVWGLWFGDDFDDYDDNDAAAADDDDDDDIVSPGL